MAVDRGTSLRRRRSTGFRPSCCARAARARPACCCCSSHGSSPCRWSGSAPYFYPAPSDVVACVRRSGAQGHPAGLFRATAWSAISRDSSPGRCSASPSGVLIGLHRTARRHAVAAAQVPVCDRRGGVDPDLRRLVRLRLEDDLPRADLRRVLPGALQHAARRAHRAADSRQRRALARCVTLAGAALRRSCRARCRASSPGCASARASRFAVSCSPRSSPRRPALAT